ncbi:uncharacterized protein LOC109535575 isoform X2 [Dendroctonus ponderosae]|uniref:Platelet-derived growth factor (PDGF) family profile domain-containing protein n=1 Tax=Dendroctonus ponderosae TaxID=77166 RepID=A0AAR5P858_DENPD|nr:uncharacterized protein LOC109535575 isoform X2 [Dendroctonus ponderosae]
MRLMFYVVLNLLVLCNHLVLSENVEELKQVRIRAAYNYGRPGDPNRDFLPLDFGMRPPPPPHDHLPYHHLRNGPPDPGHVHYHFLSSSKTNEKSASNFANTSGVPLDFAKSINEYIVSDLLLNAIEDGPEPEKVSFIANRFGGDTDGNETERNAALIARPAKCMPELTTVKIAQSDANVFYIPECIRIERCGGCCSHELLSCQPTETETVTYSDCGKYQEYRESECRCVCKNFDEEEKCYKNSYLKLWNPNICSCQCREILDCSTGFQFDHNECRCIKVQVTRRYIFSDVNRQKEQPE